MRRSNILQIAPARRRHSSSLSRKSSLTTSTAARDNAAAIVLVQSGASTMQWTDIFDGPMRLDVFVQAASNNDDTGASTEKRAPVPIMFDGPARPRGFLPGAQAQLKDGMMPSRNAAQGRAVGGEERFRSSLPSPRIYDGPAFEWET